MIRLRIVSFSIFTCLQVFKRLHECDKRLDNHEKKFVDLQTQLTTIKFKQPVQRGNPQAQQPGEAQSHFPV